MQRWLSKLRSLTISSSTTTTTKKPLQLPNIHSSHRALLHTSPHFHYPLPFPVINSIFNPHFTTTPSRTLPLLGFQSLTLLSLNNQKRGITTKERRLRRLSPIVSKVKKYKLKSYSSFKSRFRNMNDGTIRRWRAGTRHNAHLKSKISKRRLRSPALVHPAYAKVMKKLNFTA